MVAEYQVEGWEADPGSAQPLFTHEQPAGNHNGGMIQFGPDGMLYLGLGDGGGANDEFAGVGPARTAERGQLLERADV